MKDLERRAIYLVMIAAVAVPLLMKVGMAPSRMQSAEKLYSVVDAVPKTESGVAFVWLDFGPNTIAENEPQAEAVVEHLFRKRVPVILFSQYQLAVGFLETLPKRVADRLMKEMPGERWEYGKDWVNKGYQVGGALFIQSLAKAENLTSFLGRDITGTPLSDYPNFSKIKGVEDVKILAQFTGLVGTFDTFVQYFQKEGYQTPLVHGCTSITIPEAYIFLDSGQLKGLLEGVAGAAWYSHLLTEKFPKRDPGEVMYVNTALGVSHLVIIALIVLGNIVSFSTKRGER